MNKTEILVIGRHKEILETILRLINNNAEWNATGAITDDEALTAFTTKPFELVLLGAGIEAENEVKLSAAFKIQNPWITIVQHYGGGSGLLFAEIYEALNGTKSLI